MVSVQPYNKQQLHIQPIHAGAVKLTKPQPWTKDEGQHGRGPGNAKPQPFDHDRKMTAQDTLLRFILFIGLSIVHKQAYNVKQAAEPGNYEDNVECNDIIKIHSVVS